MRKFWGGRCLRALSLALVMAAPAGGAFAQDVLAVRLSALLGQERRAIAVVPSAQMAALTAPPSARTRDIQTRNGPISYDPAYLASVPPASGGADWECLAEALYFEARGENIRGMFAVGEVVLNRVDSAKFPGSVCAVVNQGTGQRYQCQFSYTCDGNSEKIRELAAWRRVGKVARLLLDGAPRDLTSGATYYHTRSVNPSWARRFDRTASIGAHYFYRA